MWARVAVLVVFSAVGGLVVLASRGGREQAPRCVELVEPRSSSAEHDGSSFMILLLPDVTEFMLNVRYSMREYKARTGRYADEWFLLDIRFRGRRGNRLLGPLTFEPKPSDGAVWRPGRSMETYIIQRASETDFLVQAIEPDGAVVAELDASMDKECMLKDPDCNKEYEDLFLHDPDLPTEREVLEPFSQEQRVSKFLNLAQGAMERHHRARDDYPASWEELGMHWAEVKHTKHDPRALPPPGTGTEWRPLGSTITYVLTRISKGQFRIDAYDDRAELKNFCDAEALAHWDPGASVEKKKSRAPKR
jgi:hypothetical protein